MNIIKHQTKWVPLTQARGETHKIFNELNKSVKSKRNSKNEKLNK